MLNIFAVSDRTGVTAERVVKAALIQFDAPNIHIICYGDVWTSERVQEIVQ